MNKRFGELCAVALKYDFRHMYFATNGMLLTEDVLGQLPEGNEARYTFTIDFTSDREFFERVRGTPNSWERIRSNIQNILSNQRWKHISIEVSDISTYELFDPIKLQRKFEELQALFHDPFRRSKVFHKTFHNATGLVEKRISSSSKKYHLCPYPWTSLFVASNGDVVACCRDLRRQTVLGNLNREKLADVWNGEPFKELRTNLVDRHPERSLVCDGCDLPYDDHKFTWQNIFRAARGRFQIFS